MQIFNLNLNPRAFQAILNKTKKIEIRADKNNSGKPNSINDMEIGDTIIFTNLASPDHKLKCSVKKITHYKSIRALLESEGTTYTLSSTNDIETGIRSIESIGGYKELIAENGVFAIEIENVKQLM